MYILSGPKKPGRAMFDKFVAAKSNEQSNQALNDSLIIHFDAMNVCMKGRLEMSFQMGEGSSSMMFSPTCCLFSNLTSVCQTSLHA